MHKLTVHIAGIPRRMRDGGLSLKRLTLFDGLMLPKHLWNGPNSNPEGRDRARPWSRVSRWWLLKRALPLAYCIECAGTTVGVAGLYELKAGHSAGVGLVIFDSNYRRKGFGRRTFALLARNLARHRLVEEVFVDVENDNLASLSFWRALGFGRERCLKGKRRLTLPLSQLQTPSSPGVPVAREAGPRDQA